MSEENNINNQQSTLDNNLKLTNKLIDNKKLQLNYIWSNKITQEDLNTPKQLDDNTQNLQLTNAIFQNIIRHANVINEIFEKLVYSNTNTNSGTNVSASVSVSNSNTVASNNTKTNTNSNDNFSFEEQVHSLIIATSAITHKFNKFVVIKTKHFKKEKYLVDPLTKLQKFYGLFKINIKADDLSRKIEDFYNYISEFNAMLEADGHLK